MSFKSIALPAILAAGLLGAAGAQADTVYLNYSNTAIGLGPSMGTGNPFANRGALESLASVIDAETATTFEQHNQTTHVWVSGGTLELVFDFEIEYDLTTFHFWNYHSEGYDVDNIDLTF
ncbi:MAG: hypothetical protein KIT73_14760, partial [Burkholderiales bacterium]|nr:hypothetical protein [Burkholderiales bacterium]